MIVGNYMIRKNTHRNCRRIVADISPTDHKKIGRFFTLQFLWAPLAPHAAREAL